MKKIIYNVWSNLKVPHTSVPHHKKESFAKYKNQLIDIQKEYARACGADYEIFNPPVHDYVNVQFFKIFKFEKLCYKYDKVVYFDLDVIPVTQKNIFNEFDFDKICVYDYKIDLNSSLYRKNILSSLKNNKLINPMNRHSKVSAKKAMLLLDDINGNDNICNTGVLCGNKQASDSLKFSKNIKMLDKKMQQAKKDSVYPNEYTKPWLRNNEVYLSYLLEKYNIEYNNIGIQWNYILDDNVKELSAGAYLIHQVNKNFSQHFERVI